MSESSMKKSGLLSNIIKVSVIIVILSIIIAVFYLYSTGTRKRFSPITSSSKKEGHEDSSLLNEPSSENAGTPGKTEKREKSSSQTFITGNQKRNKTESRDKQPSQGENKIVKSLLGEGRILRFEGKQEEALHKFRQALKKNPDNIQIHREIAAIYRIRKDYSRAIEIYEKALTIQPRNPDLWKEKAGIFLLQKKNEDAVNSFRKTLDYNENDMDICRKIADVYVKMKKYDMAEKYYKISLIRFPNNYNVYEDFAWYWYWRAAKETFNMKSAEYWQKSADLYEKVYGKVSEKDNYMKPFILFRFGEAYFHKWRKTAEEKYKKTSMKIFKKYKRAAPDHIWMKQANEMIKRMKEDRK